jgi:nicotinate-nucleotide pyrophosphorylase (carboxylating)
MSLTSGPQLEFGECEAACADRLIELALAEDLGEAGDVTSRWTISEKARGACWIVARQAGVLAGMPVASRLSRRFGLAITDCLDDGSLITKARRLARITGSMRSILAWERTALNFLQRLTGVATLTARYVEAVSGFKAIILDTRKTTPGWRVLEKYAVRCGGGHNHRIGLYDAILIKDNHLAALADRNDPIGAAIGLARREAPIGMTVEVEVDSLDQLDRALGSAPDIILIDNFAFADLGEAVRRRDRVAPSILLEASGGVSLESVRRIAETGVDRISVGALTHSAPAIDIGLDFDAEFEH